MGYSHGRERLYNIIEATRIRDIVKGWKDYKGGKDFIT